MSEKVEEIKDNFIRDLMGHLKEARRTCKAIGALREEKAAEQSIKCDKVVNEAKDELEEMFRKPE